MVGTITQQIALVSHGNEALVSKKIDADFLMNSTFLYCKDISFIKAQREKNTSKAKGYILAKNPNEWFKLLQKEGCRKLKLFYLPPKSNKIAAHMTAGFIGGGGSWLIEARYDDYSDYWTSKWKVSDKDAPDRKIWTVYYAKINFSRPSKEDKDSLADVKSHFATTLDEISEFAKEQGENSWSRVFQKARSTLLSETPNDDYYHKDLIVKENYSLEARQLLFTAGMAWVFGGMRSWNDLGFNDKEIHSDYLRLSSELFDMIKQAIFAATNS